MSTESRVSEPQQERSRESLQKILRAGMQVLIEEGWHGLTIARVCEVAGVSVGLLYRRFRGRDDLLAALQTQWVDDLESDRREITSRPIDWATLSPADAVQVGVSSVLEGIWRQEALNRIIGLRGAFDDAGLARLAAISRSYADWLREGLLHHADAIDHTDPGHAIDFCYSLIFDTGIRRATHGDTFDTGATLGDWPAFGDTLTSACCAYLFRPEHRA